jgi:hypothetical protein
MKAISYFHLSKKNKKYPTQLVEVANGTQFQALKLLKEEISKAANVLYIHINRQNKQCYIGITAGAVNKRIIAHLASDNEINTSSLCRLASSWCDPVSTKL